MLQFLTQSTWVQRTGWVLVHSLWQFALVAVLAAVLHRALSRQSASTRYWALLVAMLIAVALPVATWFSLPPADPRAVAVKSEPVKTRKTESHQETQENVAPPQHAEDAMPVATMAFPMTPMERPAALPAEPMAKPQTAPAALPPAPVGPISAWSMVKQRIQPWLAEIVLVWFGGVFLAAFRPLLSWHTVQRLRRVGVSPAGGAVRYVLDRLAKRLRLAQAVDVLQSTLVKTPVVIGHFRPLVLLPLCVVTGLPAGQLEMILAHELAHIRRHDYLVNLLQTLVETLFFYHPAVWWLSRQIRNERENCCDDVAMAALGNRADYGRALLAIEELRATSAALPLAASGGSLLARMRRIAGCEPAPRAVGGGGILCVILAAIAILAAGTWGAPPEKTTPEKAPPTASGSAPEIARATGLDPLADPLPEGCLMRLGSNRLRHGSAVECIAFSPDGQTLASAAAHDSSVCLWDAKSGKLIRSFGDPDAKWNTADSIAFSPDGAKLAVGRDYSGISIFDVKSGRVFFRNQGSRSENAIAFSPDGNFLACEGDDGRVQLWNLATGKAAKTFKTTETRPRIHGFLTGVGVGGPRVDALTVGRIASPSPGFSPDGKMLAASNGENEIHVWDLATGRRIAKITSPDDGRLLLSLAFTADSKELISSGYRIVPQAEFGRPFNATDVPVVETRFWNPRTGKLARELKTEQPEAGYGMMVLSADGKMLATGIWEAIHVWDVASGKTIGVVPNPGWQGENALALSPDGRTVASSWRDNTIALWDVARGKKIRPDFIGHPGGAEFVACSPDSALIVSGGGEGRLIAWDAATGVPKYEGQLGPASQLLSMAMSPDGELLTAGGHIDRNNLGPQDVVLVWKARTGDLVRKFGGRDGPFQDIRGLRFSSDGKLLAIAAEIGSSNAGGIDVWEIATGRKVTEIRPKDEEWMFHDMAFSADAKTLYTAWKNKVEAWDLKTGKQLRSFVANAAAAQAGPDSDALPIYAALFSPDARRLFVSQMDAVFVWDVAAGKEISKVRLPSAKKGGNLGLSRDGRLLAWGVDFYAPDPGGGGIEICAIDDTGNIRIVSHDSGRAGRAQKAGDGRAVAFAFSPDNKRLYTAMDHGTVLVWDMAAVSPATPVRETMPSNLQENAPPATESSSGTGNAAAPEAKQITNSIGMKLIYCPSGSFTMGSPTGEKGRFTNEDQVSVTISKGFYLGKYSVTQAEFKAVMGTTPWSGNQQVKEGDDYPATYVDWNAAAEFCRKLTARESMAGRLPKGYVYALPTEAQREYACRAGTTTAYSFGDDADSSAERGGLGDYAWWGGFVGGGNAQREQYAHRVGQKKPNPWGLYDMHGNVFEWCRDAYAEKLPGGTDPLVETGSDRVFRGGSWYYFARHCRSARRRDSGPGLRSGYLGFRASLVPADNDQRDKAATKTAANQIVFSGIGNTPAADEKAASPASSSSPKKLPPTTSQIDDSFIGIGIESKAQSGSLVIMRVISGSAAEQSGLRRGDRIIAIDGRQINQYTTDQGAKLLQGPEGSFCRLIVASPGKATRQLSVRRQRIAMSAKEPLSETAPSDQRAETRSVTGSSSGTASAASTAPVLDEQAFIEGTATDAGGKPPEGVQAQQPDPANSKAATAVDLAARAKAWLDQDDFDKAIAACNQALALNPKFAEAYAIRGDARLQKGDREKALADCNLAVALDPKLARAYFIRGMAWSGKGENEKAAADFQRALAIAPEDWKMLNNLAVLYWKKSQDEDREAAKAASEGDQKAAEEHHRKSVAYKKDAEAQWNRGVEVNPKATDIHSNLGYMYSERGDLDKAEYHLKEAVRLKPISPRPHNNLGRVLLRRSQQAEADARVADAKGKFDLDAAEDKAKTDKTGAEKLKLEALKDEILKSGLAMPQFRQAQAAKAKELKELSQAKLQAAIGQFEEAVILDPSLLEARLNLGEVYIQLSERDKADHEKANSNKFEQDLAKAESQYRDTLKLDSKSVIDRETISNFSQAHFGLARIALARKRPDEAIDFLKNAIVKNPQNQAVMQFLATQFFERGRFREAEQVLWSLLALQSNQSIPRRHDFAVQFCRQYEAAGKTKEALEACNFYAWAFATSREPKIFDPKEAMFFAQRAVKMTKHQDPVSLDSMAAAQAAGGKYDNASKTAQAAIDLANSQGTKPLARAIEGRLHIYQQGKPCRCDPSGNDRP